VFLKISNLFDFEIIVNKFWYFGFDFAKNPSYVNIYFGNFYKYTFDLGPLRPIYLSG
jgi:hypothetical protein